MKKTLLLTIVSLILAATNCFAALTYVFSNPWNYGSNLYDGNFLNSGYYGSTSITGKWVSEDLGSVQTLGSVVIYTDSTVLGSIPKVIELQVTQNQVLTTTDAANATWTSIKTFSNLP